MMSGIRRTMVVAARGVAVVTAFALVPVCAPSAVAAQEPSHGSTWVAPERPAHRPNPVPATTEAVSRGRDFFRANCEMCHGTLGHGDGPMARSLPIRPADLASALVQSQTDGALFWKITQGRGSMPSTQSSLSDAGRWAVIDYIRTLKSNP